LNQATLKRFKVINANNSEDIMSIPTSHLIVGRSAFAEKTELAFAA